MPFTFTNLGMNGLVLVEPRLFPDDRGFFLESYKESEFTRGGIPYRFVQDNHSLSKRNVIRGLHFQLPPRAQGKLVRVVSGRVWDVIADIRKDSPTYKQWLGIELSDENNRMIFIPQGFAHGFAVMSDDAHLLYKCTEEFDPALDAGIRWNDPDIGIEWPVQTPIVSKKDGLLPFLRDRMDI
ncbi:MAG: dTDP-4-dehydrorhamnose 3,5-epimerase [Spirochaetes bacterium RBG_13_51_14]|nr:MAG: dTDP-4-dehydrorhamnose 3,5-epimerase [Spirochaetes bacterium RBG_13_51_14]